MDISMEKRDIFGLPRPPAAPAALVPPAVRQDMSAVANIIARCTERDAIVDLVDSNASCYLRIRKKTDHSKNELNHNDQFSYKN
jgi:hypothetical protein